MTAMTSCISIIAAIAKHRVIGVNNTLPWRLSEDLKRFRALTMGHHIIMGRKTYESLGRLLPGRITVIVSRQAGYRVEDAKIASSLPEAISLCHDDEQVFIIGGAEIYREALPLADKMYLTEIDAEFIGDAWFPELDWDMWREVSREKHAEADGLSYAFANYERRQPAQMAHAA